MLPLNEDQLADIVSASMVQHRFGWAHSSYLQQVIRHDGCPGPFKVLPGASLYSWAAIRQWAVETQRSFVDPSDLVSVGLITKRLGVSELNLSEAGEEPVVGAGGERCYVWGVAERLAMEQRSLRRTGRKKN